MRCKAIDVQSAFSNRRNGVVVSRDRHSQYMKSVIRWLAWCPVMMLSSRLFWFGPRLTWVKKASPPPVFGSLWHLKMMYPSLLSLDVADSLVPGLAGRLLTVVSTYPQPVLDHFLPGNRHWKLSSSDLHSTAGVFSSLIFFRWAELRSNFRYNSSLLIVTCSLAFLVI